MRTLRQSLAVDFLVPFLLKQAQSWKRRTWFTGKVLCLLLGATILFFCIPQSAVAQEVIVHFSFDSDDGDLKKDGDGTKNGVVVWKGGAVHVVTQYFMNSAFPNPTLIIQPGAIVKFADIFQTDSNGHVTSWFPPGGTDGLFGGGPVQIDGATITDIRDDSVGGDTNQDGSASSPASALRLQFSGSNQDHLINSTIKYCNTMGHIGSMKITGNKFLASYITSNFVNLGETDTINAVPIISKNDFQFVSGASLDLRGLSPVVDANAFHSGGIEIGPAMVEIPRSNDKTLSPTAGTTVVSNNTFDGLPGHPASIQFGSSTNSLDLYRQALFRADIRNNTVRGVGGLLSLPLEAVVNITGNDVSVFGNPLTFWYDSNLTHTSFLTINDNRFSAQGFVDRYPYTVSIPASLWQNGTFVYAVNNFWGDPTGPLDASNADGLYNPRGKGITIGDGIQYQPFIGGAPPPPQDTVHITASANAAEPLSPNTLVTFNVSADFYDLKSAATGKIFLVIRDVDGIILNQPETSVNVTSANHTTSFPPVQITVPELNSEVTVEALIAPDSGGEAVHSNLIPFAINRPASKFTITGITDVATGNFPDLVRGNNTTIKITLLYTLATGGNGHFEIDLKERVAGAGTILNNYPLVTLDAPPGSGNQTTSAQVAVAIPLRDVLQTPKAELYLQVTFKDGTGVIAGKEARSIPIDEGANQVRFSPPDGLPLPPVIPRATPTVGRYYFLAGELPSYISVFKYRIGTQNVTNWQVRVGDDQALDSKGAILYQYTATSPAVDNAATGPERGVLKGIGGQVPIPAGTRTYRVFLKLVAPGNITVAYATYDVEVRVAAQSLQKTVPTGASQVAFNPLPVTLNFFSNQTAGTATVDEFAYQFGAAVAARMVESKVARSAEGSDTAEAAPTYVSLIPLNRYWGVYNDLADATFAATVTFTYNPATDFPAVPGFSEDTLVVAGLNPLSGELEVLPSTLNKAAHTVTTAYSKFFDTYVVGSPLLSSPNQIDDAQFFVHQHYLDFLNRQPDASGLTYWTGQITQCGLDTNCIHNRRVAVSNAFFFELEFQQTGSYVFRLYRAAYGNTQPFANPNPDSNYPGEDKKLLSYAVFSQDRAQVVGGANLAQAQQDLANAFVGRPEFLNKYSATLTGPQFVDAVLSKIQTDLGVDLTSQRAGLINLFNAGGRGAVMYRLADDNLQTNPINNRAFVDEEYNRAFVATQYFGYLRRDSDIPGFIFWLGQVNSGPLRDSTKQHGMVCSFITSAEYQLRFGSLVTHSNAECPQ
jgi:hypothetical protein